MIVIDPVPVCDLGLLEQPATVTKTNIAATIPKRRRRRCVIGIMNNIEIPRTRKTTCLTDVDGGLLAAGGGATNDTVAVTLATAVGLIIPEVTVTLVGIIVQDVTFGVFPVQVKFTAPVKPCDPVTVTGTEPATPLVRSNVAGAVTVNAPVAEPVPLNATLSALTPVAICRVAASAAATEGVNTTAIMHDAPAASDAPHGVAPACATKSAAFAPVTTNGIEIDAAELFVTVTDCAAVGAPTNCVPKFRLVGDTLSGASSGSSATNAFSPAALLVAV